MSEPLEDYGLIGDMETAALVSREGSIDWLCLPRFDSRACFASLLGDEQHGRWSLAAIGLHASRRRYRPETLVLETELETDDGVVRLTDFMPPRGARPDLVRIATGVRGRVELESRLRIGFDYGSIEPWVRTRETGAVAIGGADALLLRAPGESAAESGLIRTSFTLREGESVPLVLTWFASHDEEPGLLDAFSALRETEEWWRQWARQCDFEGPWRDLVVRSLITLKAMTFRPSGGIVAAPTTSLPELIGGERNWDYRYCWIRDATFTLYSLLSTGFTAEAAAWRDWLLRAVAGDPAGFQIMYSATGERRLTETTLDWLPGYEGSRPVRIGNAASTHRQLDVYGELMDALHHARRAGMPPDPSAWEIQQELLEFLETAWREPDRGIWEMRGEPRHFTHSKVLAWVAFDRAVKSAHDFDLPGPVEHWRSIAAAIHEDVCRRGFDRELGSFVQSYDSTLLDASLLLLPLVGFLPIEDARVRSTTDAIERELSRNGLLLRYPTTPQSEAVDALPPGEGAFLPCSFWLADNLVLSGRYEEGKRLFERLAGLANDLGLLAEEYDPERGRLVGNFPQAFTHIALVNTAVNLTRAGGPAERRGPQEERASRAEATSSEE